MTVSKRNSVKKSGKSAEYCHILGESADIASAAETYKALSDNLQSTKKICIDASKVNKLTTPVIQMLLSIYKMSEAGDIEFEIYNPSEAFVQSFKELGLEHTKLFQELIAG